MQVMFLLHHIPLPSSSSALVHALDFALAATVIVFLFFIIAFPILYIILCCLAWSYRHRRPSLFDLEPGYHVDEYEQMEDEDQIWRAMRLINWVVQSGDEYAEAQALTQSLLGGGGGGVGYGTLMETNEVGRFDVEEGVFVMSVSEGDAPWYETGFYYEGGFLFVRNLLN
jgi:hypothetical protein